MPSVLIAGASIAGPALAYWLNRAGFETTIVERAPAPRTGGQAIDIRGKALAVVKEMGLLERIYDMRTRLKGMTILDAAGNEASRTEERTMTSGRFAGGDVEIFRDDLADLLIEASRPATEYVFDDTVVGLNGRANGVTVTFQKASPRTFDLVFGADGLRSSVRQMAFGDDRRFLKPLGVGIAIYATPNMLDLEDWQIGFRAPSFGFVVYPTRDNRELRINFAFGMKPDEDLRGDLDAQKALIVQRCGHMGGPVPGLLGALKNVDDIYFGPLSLVQMPAWSKGRIALVGDAGYCPSPFSGQGSSLALVGAFVLAKELARSRGDHVAAFARSEARLRPYVRLNQDMVDVNRPGSTPDDVMDRAKNGIDLDDLLADR
jgi:2-polyprenyl-6-methoxyphenol hydroxylase-like FAD-dependent oxidoreductase